jgi:hypothetical protein
MKLTDKFPLEMFQGRPSKNWFVAARQSEAALEEISTVRRTHVVRTRAKLSLSKAGQKTISVALDKSPVVW